MKPIRLYVNEPLSVGGQAMLDAPQAHYVQHVMRCREGDGALLFNGRDGEWRAEFRHIGKKSAELRLLEQTQPQKTEPDIWLAFAPIKHGRIDFLAEKATELGASALIPVITAHTIVSRVNTERLQANAVEAAEQSERLSVPEVREPVRLENLLGAWPDGRLLFVGDERGGGVPIVQAAAEAKGTPVALLIGPEGGFSAAEFEILERLPYIRRVGLGPRVLRADTAALAALACLQAARGDWG
ncbi:MAG: 16S rRNA (uracil(1498)-N(3))-methyltransferase [Alphaproteobacteria bacterium]|nr:16S rRNA (uracil(1498)-N(3))-methyltransferase [Alphaproteobacteria bacterium]